MRNSRLAALAVLALAFAADSSRKVRSYLGPLFALAAFVPRLSAAPCEARVRSLRLDHAVVVVRDLDRAEARFRAAGFRVKPGRLHADNLSNRHVKFRDHTGIELMSLAGSPKDAMAREYAALLESGEKGAYAALWSDDLEGVAAAARRLGFPTRATDAAPWKFLSFPSVADAAAIFMGSGGAPANDPASLLEHENGAVGLDAAWIEGGPGLEAFLAALGGAPCGSVPLPDGRSGVRWRLQSGSLVIARSDSPGSRRLLGVELKRASGVAGPDRLEPIPGFWISMR